MCGDPDMHDIKDTDWSDKSDKSDWSDGKAMVPAWEQCASMRQ